MRYVDLTQFVLLKIQRVVVTVARLFQLANTELKVTCFHGNSPCVCYSAAFSDMHILDKQNQVYLPIPGIGQGGIFKNILYFIADEPINNF